MGKKTMAESSTHSHQKVSKKQQQLNSSLQIKFLKPRVYITDSWNFKSLVQELTGNNGGSPVSSPLRRPIIQRPVPVPGPVIDDLDLSSESSEASAPTSFETYDSTGSPCMGQPDFKTLESWLLDDVYVPMMAQDEEEDVSVYDYDLSFTSEDFFSCSIAV